MPAVQSNLLLIEQDRQSTEEINYVPAPGRWVIIEQRCCKFERVSRKFLFKLFILRDFLAVFFTDIRQSAASLGLRLVQVFLSWQFLIHFCQHCQRFGPPLNISRSVQVGERQGDASHARQRCAGITGRVC